MTTKSINETQATVEIMSGSNDTLIIKAQGAIRTEGDTTIGITASGNNNTINVLGLLIVAPGSDSGSSMAMKISGVGTDVYIGAKALVTAEWCILATGSATHITNAGNIVGQGQFSHGVTIHDGTLINQGSIYGYYGVDLGGTSKLVNEETGVIAGTSFSLLSTAYFDVVTTLINHGRLVGGIQDYYSTNRITNDGAIDGDVYLGQGNDVVDNRGGKITGRIYGAEGADTLITDKATDQLKEFGFDSEIDTVKATVSYTLGDYLDKLVLIGTGTINGNGNGIDNILVGNGANNRLRGLDGKDELTGGRGNDTLDGGTGEDRFVFRIGYDIDTIKGFENGIDKIDLSKIPGLDDFTDIKSDISKHGSDVWIDFGSGDRIVIADTARNLIEATDFLL